MSLRSILSGSRVKKRTSGAPKKNQTRNAASSRSSAVSAGLRQTKPGSGGKSGKGNGTKGTSVDDEDDLFGSGGEQDFFGDTPDKLDDSGLVASLADDLSLRDVIQALRYSRGNMFDPLPQHHASSEEGGGGGPKGYVGNSTRVAELLGMRRRMPPLATTAHVAALLPNATATERETVSLVRAGMLRKVVQPQWRRGAAGEMDSISSGSSGGAAALDSNLKRALAVASEALGEVVVEMAALGEMVDEARLSDDTKAAFTSWLGGEMPSGESEQSRFTISGRPTQLSTHMADELVQAGFLVGHGASRGLVGCISVTSHRSAGTNGRGSQSDTGDVFARPEDRTTLLSLETVAKAASGSFDAVGGVGAVYSAGGGGARAALPGRQGKTPVMVEDLMLAIPGHGMFIKLVSTALSHLVAILWRMPHREALESSLRERWDAGGGTSRGGNSSRGGGLAGFKRVPLSRTKKWKDFYGLSFDWVLAEALGAGLVELFDTGSVGRGIRLLS